MDDRRTDDQRSTELGRFLRSRRDRLTPAEVDLPGGPRRRVPGLRREEVAVLANVGTTWYTWLEQGRDVHASEQVLGSLADALLLNADERAHLFQLGGYPDRALTPGLNEVDERVHTLIDNLWPTPVVVTDNLTYAVAWNQTWRFMIDDTDRLPRESLNCTLLTFTEPGWREGYREFERHRAVSVAKLRASYSETMNDPRWPALLDRLHGCDGFTELWESGDVLREATGTKTIRSVHVGEVTYRALSLVVQEHRRLKLTVFQPADDDARRKLGELGSLITTGRLGGGLRVVS
ncbi:hypothetical protein BI335_11465 [Enemella evansiae]|uniref:helix-turn-helix transcriptional regulator n=1 Tax=Enemella evansiae TaxID=2016499 RepID=UPI000B97BBE9|nr:helix-turn-helix transcriptional regulator [Enemella evansiae]OYO15997.1 hypothetical protein BI335_11465 [Enemella evansiae]